MGLPGACLHVCLKLTGLPGGPRALLEVCMGPAWSCLRLPWARLKPPEPCPCRPCAAIPVNVCILPGIPRGLLEACMGSVGPVSSVLLAMT